MGDEAEVDWGPIRALAKRALRPGAVLELSHEVRELLRQSARAVALSSEDTTDALRGVSTATTLLQEISRRIEEGGDRLMDARMRSRRLLRVGDLRGARKPLEDVLAVEVVPLYREQAEIDLEDLARLEAVAASGHIDPDLQAWDQVRVLGLRIQRGEPLELRDDLRDFLRQAAPSVAISDADVEQALASVEGAQALLGCMVERIREGEHRIKEALSRMMDCREAGDRDGALQALRNVLAVEVVPLFRQMAQENLDRYDEPPPAL
jgi:DUSAM domain-containing protein